MESHTGTSFYLFIFNRGERAPACTAAKLREFLTLCVEEYPRLHPPSPGGGVGLWGRAHFSVDLARIWYLLLPGFPRTALVFICHIRFYLEKGLLGAERSCFPQTHAEGTKRRCWSATQKGPSPELGHAGTPSRTSSSQS